MAKIAHTPTLKSLQQMTRSADSQSRLDALRLMREQINAGRSPLVYAKLARPLIKDCDNDCRWQALIIVGECITSEPQFVWKVICEFGTSPDEDMRAGVATVLLEHLLEHHFDAYLPKLRALITSSGSADLADTLSLCWSFGQSELHETT